MIRGRVISDSPEKTVYKCPECFGDGCDCDDSSKPCFECGGDGIIFEYKEENKLKLSRKESRIYGKQ